MLATGVIFSASISLVHKKALLQYLTEYNQLLITGRCIKATKISLL